MALGILWALKSTKASLGFPLMVLGLVGFRKLMDYTPKIFSQRDLFWLDNLMPSSNDKKEKTDENGLGNDDLDAVQDVLVTSARGFRFLQNFF